VGECSWGDLYAVLMDRVVLKPMQVMARNLLLRCRGLGCVPTVPALLAVTAPDNVGGVDAGVWAQDFAADCRALWAGG